MTVQTIKFRRGTSSAWTAANPILADGEPGRETDTGLLKIGDGVTHWNLLGYYLVAQFPALLAAQGGETTTGAQDKADAALADAQDFTTEVVDNLLGADNPFTQYARGLGEWQPRWWRAGTVPGVGTVPFPTVLDGLAVGDLIVNYG